MWSVYCLQTIDKPYKTYIGATIDVDRRLRQHNGLLVGGAFATKGRTWKRMCHVVGFNSEKQALQFEWAWKYYSRKLSGQPMQKRIEGLLSLLNAEKVTSNADYMPDLEVVWENNLDPFDLF